MAEFVTGFQTAEGVKKYDFHSLANKPESIWNAVRGKASAEVVRINDVSSAEHIIDCKVKSKNLFNTLSDYKNGDYTYENGTLTLSARYIHKFIRLEAGKTYTFSCKSTRTGTTGGGVHIRAYTEDQQGYMELSGGSQISILSPTVTVTLPVGYPYIRFAVYGHSLATDTGTATYTELMLNEGDTALPYVPYVDPANVAVNVSSRNLIPYPYASVTGTKNGVTFTVNSDRSVNLKGTPTADAQFDLVTDIKLPAGTYHIAGNGNNVRARVLKADGSTVFSLDDFTVEDGDSVRVYVVALANETINYTVFPMLNMGEKAVPYEPYAGGVYVSEDDGTVEGVVSISPTMIMFTDTANELIDCEYSRDANVVIGELLDIINKKARVVEVTILANKWVGTSGAYSQVVTVEGATEFSRVDLTPSVEQLSIFYNKSLAFVTENVDGVITVYAIGEKPTDDFTIQATVTEVYA